MKERGSGILKNDLHLLGGLVSELPLRFTWSVLTLLRDVWWHDDLARASAASARHPERRRIYPAVSGQMGPRKTGYYRQ